MTFDVVVPTVARQSLHRLLEALAASRGPVPARVLVVDDRALVDEPLDLAGVEVFASGGRGPAAARNVGWRAATAPWIAFLDDDVVPAEDWAERLAEDLAACAPTCAGTAGRIMVALPADRRPTDWERNVAGLERARWATADLAYRRAALAEVGGFDERFPRAYREDADLGLRLTANGWGIEQGARVVAHPPGAAGWSASVGKQAGNADDALMDRLHGPGWRERAAAPAGGLRRHLATTAAGAGALVMVGAGHRRGAVIPALAWVGLTAQLAWRRIAPGPRTAGEVASMVATSTALPAAASAHWLAGSIRARRLVREHRTTTEGARRPFAAVLFDRDATLVVDVPYNGNPELVEPVTGAKAALDRLRSAGLAVGVVTNQSGVARGLISPAQMEAVNERAEKLLGPFGAVLVCPHGPEDGCECRKPRPGMVQKACAELGVAPADCAMVGDIGADVGAAIAAGAWPVLVPTPVTRAEEVAAATVVAPDLASAVDLVLAGRAPEQS